MIIGLFITVAVSKLIFLIPFINSDSVLASIYVNTIAQSIFAIALPAFLIVAWTNIKPLNYLKLNRVTEPNIKVVFTLLAFIFSYTFASFLTTWNKGVVLPEWMSQIEEAMRTMEDAALETTELLLSGKSVSSLILNLVVIAGFAAISEELFFRGAMQQFIHDKFKNGHTSVWIAAIIFSIVHFQFYGFLPRLFLGAILGYLFLYTKNLWIPILFHFINNALIIVVNFFWGETNWYNNMEDMPITPVYIILALVSLAATITLFVIYNKRASKIKNYDTDSKYITI